MSLVLASASPRRREILTTLGIDFRVEPSDVEERERAGEPPAELAARLATEKACAVSRRSDAWVLGADTVVVVEGRVLGKPVDDADASRMLAALSGRWHEVITGVALARAGEPVEAFTVSTRVHVLGLDEVRRARYVATGEGRDKAGAYGIQGIASGLVDRIEGSWSNVVGLPAAETVALLERHGVVSAWP